MQFFKTAIISGFAIAASSVFAQTLPDIGGVKIGTLLSTQKPLMEKVNADYQFSEIKTREGKVVGIQGIAENPKNGVNDHMIALQDDSGKIWFLGRAQKYSEGAYIPKATFLSALKQKYGTPTEITPDEQSMLWAYDRNYALTAYKASIGMCPFGAGGNVTTPRTELSRLKGDGINISVPAAFEPNCGIQLNVKLNRHHASNMIVGSSIQIVDHKTRYDVLEKKNNEEEAARNKALDAMKDNKPKL
jgi:hypothetical protein